MNVWDLVEWGGDELGGPETATPTPATYRHAFDGISKQARRL